MSTLIVFIDPAAAPEDRQRELISKELSEIGAKYEFVAQRIERSISWQTELSAPVNVLDLLICEIFTKNTSPKSVQFFLFVNV